MSRFYLSITHAQLVSIHISADLLDRIKPAMVEVFGIKFLQSEYLSDSGLYMYDFESDWDEIERIQEALKDIIKKRQFNVTIDLNLN